MRSPILVLGAVAICGATHLLGAQARAGRAGADAAPGPSRAASPDTGARTLLGITVSLSGSDRDTLGVLVSTVVRDGPADAAGVDEGNRIAEINGVSLRIDPPDVGQRETEELVLRRLARTLRGVRPGDDVALRVFGAGRFRSVTIRVPNASTIGASVTAPETVPGLRVIPVGDELAVYFGDGSELGLLVLEADASWQPLRVGDVILRVDGVAADVDALRDAGASRAPVRIELLRRKRQVAVTLHARE